MRPETADDLKSCRSTRQLDVCALHESRRHAQRQNAVAETTAEEFLTPRRPAAYPSAYRAQFIRSPHDFQTTAAPPKQVKFKLSCS